MNRAASAAVSATIAGDFFNPAGCSPDGGLRKIRKKSGHSCELCSRGKRIDYDARNSPRCEDGCLIGPMFTREAAVAPRRASFFVARTLFVGLLFALTLTAWQLLVGSQRLESIGDLAWFGAAAFQILARL